VASTARTPSTSQGKWVDAVDEYDRRRLDDPDDLVLLEIATALQRNVRVIPVLVDGTPPPRRNDLPDALAPLARRHAPGEPATGD
jgi:hypothetical protein